MFAQEHWERSPLIIERDDTAHYAALLSIAEVWGLANSGQVRYPECRLVRDGTDLAAAAYVDRANGSLDADRLALEYENGATLIVSGAQRYSAALWRLCRNVEDFLSHRVQANVYLTPPGAQALAPHFDTHDVFVMQIAGTKHWRIYEAPIHLPDAAQDMHIEDRGILISAQDFSPGTLAYLPRGFVHEASAADEASLHVTLGVAAVTWADLLGEMLAGVEMDDARFRAGLPIGFARDLKNESIPTEFTRLMGELSRPDLLDDALRSLRARLLLQRAPLMDRGDLSSRNEVGGPFG